MPEVVSYPLIPGIRQDADRTMLPAGSVVAASGVSVRKGAIAKANGFVTAGTTTQSGSMAGPCDALGFAAGRQISVMAGRTYAREGIGDTWMEVGRAPRARPVKAHWAAFVEVGSGSVSQPACATIGEFIASACFDGAGVQLSIRDSVGIVRATGFYTDRDIPRIFAVGSTFVLVFRDIGGAQIYGRTIDGTTLVVSSETSLSNLQVSSDVFDAAPFSATQWLLARRNGATTFTVALWGTNLGAGEVANEAVTVANNTVTACSVYGTDGENIFAAWSQTTAGVQQIAAFAEDLSSTIFAPTTFTTTAGDRTPVMTRRNSTSVWLVFEENFTSPTRNRMGVRAYDTALGHVTAADAFAWHVRIASRPWSGTTSAISMWVQTDGGSDIWFAQRRYTLLTLSMDADTPGTFGMFLEPELAPDERSHAQQSSHVPEVAFRTTTDESGAFVTRGYFPALTTIRTQSDVLSTGTPALTLYEWETEGGTDARSRQIAEVGGQGVIFSGGLQEIPSARINVAGIDTEARGVENGFVFSPAIISATKTATGSDGLTVDTLYQFRAVFEYITADGLRTRSAPSNIATETPTAGLLNVELIISTSPSSEREFSSPPNATAVHIYATTGGGKTFQRITPDAGLAVGVGDSATGHITYVHSAADTTYFDNEALYTEKGGVANQPAPAHRFGWIGGGYAWVAGLFNPQIFERSKLSVPNEPIQFTRQNTHRGLLPEACTGGAWLDNVSVLFSRTGIYAVSASLGAPQRLPSTVGCLDFRSVVELPMGIGFQSRRGYEILPRGFGHPELISGPVEDSLRGRRVISATVTGHSGSDFASAARVGERHLVLFAIEPSLASDPGVRLTFDLDARRWIDVRPALTASTTFGEHLTTWDGRLVIGSRAGTTIRYQSPTDWGATEAVPVSVTLADLRPFDVLKRGQISRVLVLGEVRSSTTVTLTAYTNGEYSKPLVFNSKTQTVHGTAGDKFTMEWVMPLRQVNALTFKIDCADAVLASPGEGVVLHAIGIEADGLPGRPRVNQERTAA